MSWPVALVMSYVLLGIEMVLPGELRLGPTSVAPSFVMPLVVFIAMHASAVRAYWSALLVGLALDLLTPWGGELIVPGPRALGFLLAAYLVVTVRTLINRNLVGLVVFSIAGTALSQVVVVALLTLRSLFGGLSGWHARDELVQRMFSALYTGGSAAVLGLVLFSMIGVFRFQDPYSSRGMGGIGRGSVGTVRSRRG